MKFFQSDQVRQELESIFESYQNLSKLNQLLPQMDSTERIEHINNTKKLVEKQKLVYTRLSLASAEDQDAMEMKEKIDEMTSLFGYNNLLECIQGMSKILDDALRRELDRDK